LDKRNKRQAVKDIRISYEYDWQKLHWRSLESSYRRSPFFEYYEEDFLHFYETKKFDFLIDFNNAIQETIFDLLKIHPTIRYTEEYKLNHPDKDDFRPIITPKEPLYSDPGFTDKPYHQVFSQRHGYLPNLSIVDVLFNEGSKAGEYI
jgi:hypothetical protein